MQSILKFKTLDEAIERANNTTYGLAAGILTHNLENALIFSNAVEAGSVWVNCFLAVTPQTPVYNIILAFKISVYRFSWFFYFQFNLIFSLVATNNPVWVVNVEMRVWNYILKPKPFQSNYQSTTKHNNYYNITHIHKQTHSDQKYVHIFYAIFTNRLHVLCYIWLNKFHRHIYVHKFYIFIQKILDINT